MNLIIGSRGRLESLRRCVNSALAYAESVQVTVFFDDDELCYHAFEPPLGCVKVLLTPRGYYVKTMNRALGWLMEHGAEEFVVANNDMEFVVPRWDGVAKKALYTKFPDGMGVIELGSADLTYNSFISHTAFWRERYESKLFDERFTQYYADGDRLTDLRERGWFSRLIPGLVHTHSCWDEVKHDGMQWLDTDREVANETAR